MTAAEMKKISAKVKRQRFLRRLMLALLLVLVVLLLMERNFKPLVFSLAEARSAAMAAQVPSLSGAKNSSSSVARMAVTADAAVMCGSRSSTASTR